MSKVSLTIPEAGPVLPEFPSYWQYNGIGKEDYNYIILATSREVHSSDPTWNHLIGTVIGGANSPMPLGGTCNRFCEDGFTRLPVGTVITLEVQE